MSDDLICRQTAILALVHEQSWNMHEDQRTAIGVIAVLPPADAQRWIPCSERLPEPKAPSQKREWFITSNQYGGVTQTCYEFEGGVFCKGWQTNFEILAWQPLPKPYKGGEKE